MRSPNDGLAASIAAFFQARVLAMLLLGFSAGIPLLLIFSSLSLWLREAGIDRATVTLFSWAALGYSFKFVWAPLVDQLPLPWLSAKLGRRRAWLLSAQCGVVVAILWMATVDPGAEGGTLTVMAIAAVLLGFSSATQDIVIDAYRIESAEPELQALMSATYVAGYRIGMVVSGAGSLYLADWFGSSGQVYRYEAWQQTYQLMALVMLIGIATTLWIREPDTRAERGEHSNTDYLRFLLLFALTIVGLIAVYLGSAEIAAMFKRQLGEWLGNQAAAGFVVELLRLACGLGVALGLARLLVQAGVARREMVEQAYLRPIRDFFTRYGLQLALWLLLLIGVYRISDIVLGAISNVFYEDMGFSKTQIADASKFFGLLMTICGGFVGGLLTLRFGVIRILMLGAVLAAATNLLFLWLALVGQEIVWLYIVISIDNLSAGIAIAAFIAFLSSLTNVSFTAMQYAIFSSLFSLIPKTLGGYSGAMVDALGYPLFFACTALMGLPVLYLIWIVAQRFQIREAEAQ